MIVHELHDESSGPTIPNRQWQSFGHSSIPPKKHAELSGAAAAGSTIRRGHGEKWSMNVTVEASGPMSLLNPSTAPITPARPTWPSLAWGTGGAILH
jgi:hypothetical protein